MMGLDRQTAGQHSDAKRVPFFPIWNPKNDLNILYKKTVYQEK